MAKEQVEQTYDSEYVICPYCKCQHGDAWEFCRQDEGAMNCQECGKKFIYWANVDVTYHAAPSKEGDERTQ